jgi:integrase
MKHRRNARIASMRCACQSVAALSQRTAVCRRHFASSQSYVRELLTHPDTDPTHKTMHGRKTAKTGRQPGGREKEDSGREVERLIEAAKDSRNGERDRCLLLLMFRHGLRVSEACGLKLDQVDAESRVLHVRRLKGGLSTMQPLRGGRAAGCRRLA